MQYRKSGRTGIESNPAGAEVNLDARALAAVEEVYQRFPVPAP